MNYRISTILAAESQTTAKTKVIEILDRDPLSSILLKFRTTATSDTMNGHGAKDITKLELIDGSDVLYSANGYLAQALAVYDRRCDSLSHGQHVSGNGEYNVFPIDFGRYLWDPVLALDPTRFKNLQLRITFTLTGAYSAGAAAEIEVLGFHFDEKVISPMGFLSAKQFYDAACPANGSFHYVDMPTDMPYRKLILRGFADAKEPWYNIQTLRLDEDNQKKIPFDMDLETYARIMKGTWRAITESIAAYSSPTGTNFYVMPSDYYMTVMGCAEGLTYPLSTLWANRGGKVSFLATGSPAFFAMVRGYLPNHCWEIPFGDDKNVEDWYDVTKLGHLRARLEGGDNGTSGTAQILTQQLRKY